MERVKGRNIVTASQSASQPGIQTDRLDSFNMTLSKSHTVWNIGVFPKRMEIQKPF